jgi:predicted enzyme related to lactoylglutathione lyase
MLSESAEPAPAESILYFRVSDIDTAWQRVLERGGASISAQHIIHRHEDGTEEWMAFFEDLEGRPMAIMSRASAKLDP